MQFENCYQKNPNFPNRYILPETLFKYLQENLSDYISVIGESTLNKPIYKLSIGKGQIKVLAWSQMHGNESNSTHAMLDLLETANHYPELLDSIWNEIQLDFIFMLNPDGSELWKRRNALDIDLNRDFLMNSSIEFPFLKSIAQQGNYDYAFNLHEQRTLFSTDGQHPATLSFLSPAQDVDRTITETRKKSMAVIASIHDKMQTLIPNHIARYNDEFYPTSTGDNFTKMGIPVILYEGGHYENDYLRMETRKAYTIALFYGLKAISNLKGRDNNWQDYFLIPENKEDHFDIIYRNVKLNTRFDCIVDVAVQYKEIIEDGKDEISFIPYVVEVGDCGKRKGWKEIDCTGKFFKSNFTYPKLDDIQNFEIV